MQGVNFGIRKIICLATVSIVVAGGAQPADQRAGRTQQHDGRGERGQQMQCPMMAGLRGIELHADSPAVLQARADELGLSEEQTEQLRKIRQTARQQARALLTPEQRERLAGDPAGPMSMMDMGRMRMRRMRQRDDPNGHEMCPMCLRMMQPQDPQR